MARIDIRLQNTDRLREALANIKAKLDSGEFRMRLAEPDPWVQVGTTAVDGTFAELAEAFNVLAAGVGASIHGLIEGERVVSVRGMNLRPREWMPLDGGVGMVLCDVVRRQSEIDAEREAAFDAEVAAMEARDYPNGLPRPTCPECSPHGNAGRVLLLESWVDCTTCRPLEDDTEQDERRLAWEDGVDAANAEMARVADSPTMGGFVVPSLEEYNRYMARAHADIAMRLQVPQALLFGTGPTGFTVGPIGPSFIVKPNGDVEGAF